MAIEFESKTRSAGHPGEAYLRLVTRKDQHRKSHPGVERRRALRDCEVRP
jgi:hypothetical protein